MAQAEATSSNGVLKHVAVAGNIGAGKTTLTYLLSRHYRWEPHYEEVEENPYIIDFYEDMRRWAFHLQVYFLQRRFQHIMRIREQPYTVIQDRTIYEDAQIFAPNLHQMGLLNTRDYENYRMLFETMRPFLQPPDLLIYLRAGIPTLVEQIEKRGRKFEEALRLDYLRRLNELYEAWIAAYDGPKLMVVNVDELDFENKAEDLGSIIERIDSEVTGLFGLRARPHPKPTKPPSDSET
jgi:deoxyadenosine/deoxycytidine kinase